jgi:hypothetical protein
MTRRGYSIFCDDIRNEVGGKLSFIGCYNAVMFVPSQFPCLLPKFCVHFFMLSRATEPFKSIIARCYVPEVSRPVLEEAIDVPQVSEQVELVAKLGNAVRAPRYLAASASLIFAPLELRAPGLIRVRAVVDGGRREVTLGSLKVALAGG